MSCSDSSPPYTDLQPLCGTSELKFSPKYYFGHNFCTVPTFNISDQVFGILFSYQNFSKLGSGSGGQLNLFLNSGSSEWSNLSLSIDNKQQPGSTGPVKLTAIQLDRTQNSYTKSNPFLPMGTDAHTVWVMVDARNMDNISLSFGIDAPFGQNPVVFDNLGKFTTFTNLNIQVNGSILLPLENVWVGNTIALKCAGQVPQNTPTSVLNNLNFPFDANDTDTGDGEEGCSQRNNPSPVACRQIMTEFCQACPNAKVCDCYNFQNSEEWTQLKNIPGMPPYQCWAQPCIGADYVPPLSGPQICPCKEEICLQIIDIGKSNVNIQNTPIYQSCGGKPTPPGPPQPSNNNLIYWIIGFVVFLIIVIVITLLLIRKK